MNGLDKDTNLVQNTTIAVNKGTTKMRTVLFIAVAIGSLAILQTCMVARVASDYKDTINERVYKTHNPIADAVLNAQETLQYLKEHN